MAVRAPIARIKTASVGAESLVRELGPNCPVPCPETARILGGRYLLRKTLAHGASSRVFLAEQRPLGRAVALKVLDLTHCRDRVREVERRFFFEAALASKLSHPNTVRIFDFGRAESTAYITMEYVEGERLSDIVRRIGPLLPERVVRVAVQIARSLCEAHTKDVVHRDLKSCNVMLTSYVDEDDYVKVMDFGLAKDLSEWDTVTDGFSGSPRYASPEQISGQRLDGRSDLYSVGILLYELLTSRVPFDRESAPATLYAHLHDPVPPMRASGGLLVPKPLERLVLRCLSKRPEDRPESAQELLSELRYLLARGSSTGVG